MNKRFDGLTVNERLFTSGLLIDFDDAVEQRNEELLVSILRKIEICDEDIKRIVRLKIG